MNNIFKNPSSADFDFIEEIVTKFKLEDQFLTYLDEEARQLIVESSSANERSIYKSLYEEFFPYTKKLWEEIFLIINNKIPLDLVAADFEKRSGLPTDICSSIAQELINNPTIKKEISAIRLEEDIQEDYDEYNEFPESEEDIQERKDEQIVADIEEKIGSGQIPPPEKKDGGLGQELL